MEQKLCQSCAMPMTGQEQMGREKDGSVNEDYCRYCYVDGAFDKPDETLEQMISTSVPFMVEQGMEEDKARAGLEAVLPGLKRWKK